MTHTTEVLFPSSVDEAVSLFGDGAGVTVVAGGTIVVPEITYGRVPCARAHALRSGTGRDRGRRLRGRRRRGNARRAARAARGHRPRARAPPNIPEWISDVSASTLTTTLTIPRRLTVAAGCPTAAFPVSHTRMASSASFTTMKSYSPNEATSCLATENGAGILVDGGAQPTLQNLTIQSGTVTAATAVGGGLFTASSLTLTNVTFFQNVAFAGHGGGLGGGPGAHLKLINVIFNGNGADLGGGGLYAHSASIVVHHSLTTRLACWPMAAQCTSAPPLMLPTLTLSQSDT